MYLFNHHNFPHVRHTYQCEYREGSMNRDQNRVMNTKYTNWISHAKDTDKYR